MKDVYKNLKKNKTISKTIGKIRDNNIYKTVKTISKFTPISGIVD